MNLRAKGIFLENKLKIDRVDGSVEEDNDSNANNENIKTTQSCDVNGKKLRSQLQSAAEKSYQSFMKKVMSSSDKLVKKHGIVSKKLWQDQLYLNPVNKDVVRLKMFDA